MAGLHQAFVWVAIILFLLSAVPPMPYGTSLERLGWAFLGASFVAP